MKSKEIKIALMAIVAIVLLFIGLNMLKGVNVFKSTNTFYVKFADVAGLTESSPVYANGYNVGIVSRIDYTYDRTDQVIVVVDLNKSMNVPQGTRAELESELMGGVKMSLVLGQNPTALLTPGDTISGGIHEGAMVKLEKMLPTFEQMLPKLDTIMANLQRLTGDSALLRTLHNTAAITADLRQTTHTLNGMMANDVPQMVDNLKRTSAHVEQITADVAKSDIAGTMQSVNHTMASMQTVSANLVQTTSFLDTQMRSRDNSLGLFLNDAGFYNHLTSTMSHADSLMIDLKAHPKRYVHFSIFGKKDK